MIPTEVREIITKLLIKSRANQVNWVHANELDFLEEVSNDSDDFVVNMSKFTLNVFRVQLDMAFNIYDSRGTLIYHFSLPPDNEDYKLMEELLSLAKRNVLNIENLLNEIKLALDSDEIIGARQNSQDDEDIPF